MSLQQFKQNQEQKTKQSLNRDQTLFQGSYRYACLSGFQLIYSYVRDQICVVGLLVGDFYL